MPESSFESVHLSDEIDRFVDALLAIKAEIDEVACGSVDPDTSVLRNAPHTAEQLTADEWTKPYSRSKAAYPVKSLRTQKYWSPVGRIDNVYGDRNLVCSCAPISDYAE